MTTSRQSPPFGAELAAGCRELAAKFVAYYLVRLRPHWRAASGRGELTALVAATCRRDPEHAAFLLEGLCYEYVRRALRARRQLVHLLDGEAAAALPERSLILLHVGLGMALTEVLIRPLRPRGQAAAVDGALDRFAALVAANARPEYAPVCFESLGLMVRRFMPHLHVAVEERLRVREPGAAAGYWHGAGRGIYFLASLCHPFPGTARRGLAICRREPPLPGLRLDAIAGFAFASTMINLRQPELVARLLLHVEPEEIEAVASGVAGALMTRYHTRPEATEVRDFLRPVAAPWPGELGARLAALWDGAVRMPATAAMDRAYPLLRARGELASFARHRPLGTVLAPAGEP
ncbi:MAG TPA: hypothetical protein VKY89_18295 [Thermoanaerobaculia bacterium]|jgi:hypothetical protein|nr:hypothetical protein [Thermoanaerobaculia bacterium]